MPKLSHIKRVLVIGSGPIKIGQACEFDYSGTQALKALKEEGLGIILINSNPATIMTDANLADCTYVEPITPEYVTAIIEKERPDALIATLGGQTSLNCALDLFAAGILQQYQVELLGASVEAIKLAENRTLFHQKMKEIGIDVAQSRVANDYSTAMQAVNELGLPLIIRSSFTLGGAGSAVVHSQEAAEEFIATAFANNPTQELTLDEALIGWKEFELEVVRDRNDNCIVVCGVENVDPLGIHTGDSITVAPIQTLTDPEYQHMRNAAFTVLRAVGVDTGGSNVQFAVHPVTGRQVVIEMNPRVSRSSALVSKATGFPIAKIAAKLAIGYTLDELANDITDGCLPAAFEPSIDYVITKIPRFHDEKFNAEHLPLGPQMRSIGEVMAIGSTFCESLQYAICSLETAAKGLDSYHCSDADLQVLLSQHTSQNLWFVAEALRRDYDINYLQDVTHIDPWFLQQLKEIIQLEKELCSLALKDINPEYLLKLKKYGFADLRLAQLLNCTEEEVRAQRQHFAIYPVYKCIDSCAGEYKTSTAYMYSTYQQYCEAKKDEGKKVIIVGSGPNRIGQGIEFDYVCVKAIEAFKSAGFTTIMVNCNPETVSTDYDVADKLYFVPLIEEKIRDIIAVENPELVALQFGGQTPLNLLNSLENTGVNLCGLDSAIVDHCEDRGKFRALLQKLNLRQPKNVVLDRESFDAEQISTLNFPVIMRPSFILGGKSMEIFADKESLLAKIGELLDEYPHPILIEEFLHAAIEVDVDAISDGVDVFIPSILEHIEAAGIHSGDSACITPPQHLSKAMQQLIRKQTKKIAQYLGIKGLFNIQFAVKNNEVYVIEVNPRASRTTPFICKATGLPLINIAVNCMLGASLRAQRCLAEVSLPYYFVKEALLPFANFLSSSSAVLGPEMKATGEVMGIGRTPAEAYRKAQLAVGVSLPDNNQKNIFISGTLACVDAVKKLVAAGYVLVDSYTKAQPPALMIIVDNSSSHLAFAVRHRIPYVSTNEAAVMLIESLCNTDKELNIYPLQSIYTKIKHANKLRHLISGKELSGEQIHKIIDLAVRIKNNPGEYQNNLEHKTLAMIFAKPSFRTRLSFTKAMDSLGGGVIESVSSGRKTEEPQDFIRVLNAYCDFVMVRTHDDNELSTMAEHALMPIINGLSALYHPCQILADLLTLKENFGHLSGLSLAYIGDGNNILHSLLIMAPKLGLQLNFACPPGHGPDKAILAEGRASYPGLIKEFNDPKSAVKDVHAVYTDVWVSMGFANDDLSIFSGFQVNEELMENARPEAAFMHCMPMERGKEVATELPDQPNSLIFMQSENRLHIQKAILVYLAEENRVC